MSQHPESLAGLAAAWAATIASWINTASGVSVNRILQADVPGMSG